MHMLLVILGGVALLGLFLLFGHLWGGTRADLAFAAKLFVPIWGAAATFNMWVGVAKAGYSVREELPILFIVVLIPSALAAFAIWRVSR